MSECQFAKADGISFVIEKTSDGIFLFERRKGSFVGDTWHASIAEAKAQANFLADEPIESWRTVTKIHVKLLNEGTDVWAPIYAEHVNGDVYRIVDCWGEEADVEFGEGTLVRCKAQALSGGEWLVAHEAA